MKYLIINADDFGYSKVFNEKILELIEKDLVSSTSVMVDWIDEKQKHQVQQLIDLSKTHNISIGLHVDFKNTNFDKELHRQYELFMEIFGFKPIHVDLHKIIYLHEGYPYIIKFSEEKNIPCKNLGVEPFTKLMTKDTIFDGTKKDIDELEKWLLTLKDDEYYTIIFHPGKFDPESKSSLNKEREADAENIIKLNNLFSEYDVKLISYSDFAATL